MTFFLGSAMQWFDFYVNVQSVDVGAIISVGENSSFSLRRLETRKSIYLEDRVQSTVSKLRERNRKIKEY